MKLNQIGLNIQDFHESGAEDVALSLTWRHDFHMNEKDEDDSKVRDYAFEEGEYSPFLMTPFFKITGILGIGKERNEAVALSLPFGNNGHHGVSLIGGLSFDFHDSVEIAFSAGTSHFFKRDIAGMFIPNEEHQSGIFPFKTNVSYNPGKSWYFSLGMNAYRFLEKLSFHAEYLFISHSKDSIKLLKADGAFKPAVLEDQTKWTIQAINCGFNYDLTPNFKFGVSWQAPIKQQGAYKTNTVMVTLAATF